MRSSRSSSGVNLRVWVSITAVTRWNRYRNKTKRVSRVPDHERSRHQVLPGWRGFADLITEAFQDKTVGGRGDQAGVGAGRKGRKRLRFSGVNHGNDETSNAKRARSEISTNRPSTASTPNTHARKKQMKSKTNRTKVRRPPPSLTPPPLFRPPAAAATYNKQRSTADNV